MNRVRVLRETLDLFRNQPGRWPSSSFVDALANVALEAGQSLLPLFDVLYEVIGPGKSLVEWQAEPRTHAEVLALLERAIAISEGHGKS